jgi:hypothetical protein
VSRHSTLLTRHRTKIGHSVFKLTTVGGVQRHLHHAAVKVKTDDGPNLPSFVTYRAVPCTISYREHISWSVSSPSLQPLFNLSQFLFSACPSHLPSNNELLTPSNGHFFSIASVSSPRSSQASSHPILSAERTIKFGLALCPYTIAICRYIRRSVRSVYERRSRPAVYLVAENLPDKELSAYPTIQPARKRHGD